ncbi:hypothetical protein HOLleu_19140 [Holothuria leucospilota]|uniref:Protein kinase domain-containing protein n=1 Tax=Holothuria leucospilota TaxID=206669 RepID=A0A9Q1HAF3_HOLLE|nr:hypothetical protein HOLleu_19140 [Holothuria leucospilota]
MICNINEFAPEALYRNEYTKASDVWSMAVVIWEMLSGEKENNSFKLFAVKSPRKVAPCKSPPSQQSPKISPLKSRSSTY